MSKTIDERVVSMKFDNRHFEKNVQNTIGTLGKLKQSLNLTGASKGLENLGSAASKVNTPMSGLGGAVETVRSKFSALEVMGVTALANITNSAVNAGKRMVSALTIDPIKTGFSEYETQINAIQTILANTESKGSTLQDVNNALSELNTYADKTIYNFTEMTRNIGTFTAAGVDLDTSVSAIKGIANLAAVSGSTSQQASTAMYQLSQALSSGTVKLMDWNSVVNAGMGGQVFQDSLKETARVHGVKIDEMIKKEGSFRETLKDGWLTSEILTETLSKFTGDLNEKQLKAMGYTEKQIAGIMKMGQTANDAATKVKTFTQLFDTLKEAAQSGWTKTWEIIVGDFGEAKGLLTEISDTVGGVIGSSADSRNQLLSGALSSGWKQLLNEGITDAAGFEEKVTNVAKKHGVDLSKMIDDETTFQDTLKEGWLTTDILGESIDEYGSKLKNMSAKELEAAGYTKKDVQAFEELEKKLKDGTISLEEFTKVMTRPSGRELLIESLRNSIKGLLSVLTPIKEAFREIFPATTAEHLYSLIERFRDFTARLTIGSETADKLKRTFKGVFALLDIGVQIIKALFKGFSTLVGYLAPAGEGILGFTAGVGDLIVKLDGAIKSSNIFTKIIEYIGRFLKPVADGVKFVANAISESFADIADKAETRFEPLGALGQFVMGIFMGVGKIIQKVAPWLAKAASGIGNAMSGLMSDIADAIQNADYEKLFDILNGGIMSAIGIFIAKFIKGGSELLGNAGGFLENINNILGGVGDALGAFTQSIKADILKKIATAIAILAASLFVIALIDSEKLTSSLESVTLMLLELMGAMAIFGKISADKGLKDMLGMYVMASAMSTLAKSLLILAVALKLMSTMSPDAMGNALTAMSIGLSELVAAVYLMSLMPEKKLGGSAKTIKKLASSLLVLSVALKIMATMSWDELKRSLTAASVGLAALVAAVNLLPKDTLRRTAGMTGLATAMIVLGAALKIMATMSWDDIGRSLTTLAGSLGILAGALALMKKSVPGALAMTIVAPALIVLSGALKIMATMSWDDILRSLTTLAVSLGVLAGSLALMRKGIPGALAMTIIAPALIVMAAALKIMGSMSWEEIARGLVVVAGAFVVIGVSALLLKPLVGTILALSASLALLGVAVGAIGTGILALGAGLLLIEAAGSGLSLALVAIVSSLIGLIPFFIEQVGVGLIKLCDVIAGGATSICEAATAIILALVDALVQSVPAVAEGALVLVEELLVSLVRHAPAIISSLFDFVILLLQGIAARLPELIQAGVDVLMAFFSGVVAALKTVDIGSFIEGIMAAGVLAGLVYALVGISSLIPAAMVGVLGLGAIMLELSAVFIAVGALAELCSGLEGFLDKGIGLMVKLADGIGQMIGAFIGGVAEQLASHLPAIGTALSQFMINATPFIAGIKTVDDAVFKGVGIMVAAILALTVADLLNGIVTFLSGGNSFAQLGTELSRFMKNAEGFIRDTAQLDPHIMDGVKTLAESIQILCSANMLDTIVGWLGGESSLSKFGTEIGKFGTSLKTFVQNIGTFGDEQVKTVDCAGKAVKALASAASTIPKSGGLWQGIVGEQSLASFGEDLGSLGTNLNKFVRNLGTFGDDKVQTVQCACDAVTKLAEAAKTLPKEGGLWQKLVGENSLAAFADDLPALADGINGFVSNLNDMGTKIDTVKVATAAIANLASAADACKQTSWDRLIGADTSLSKFADELPDLGKQVQAFATAVSSGMTTDAAEAVAGVGDVLQAVSMFAQNGASGSADNLQRTAANLEKFAHHLKGFANTMSYFAADDYKYTQVENLAEYFDKTVEKVDMILDSIRAFDADQGEEITARMKEIGETVKNFGEAVAIKWSESFHTGESTIKVQSGVTKMFKAVTSAISDGCDKDRQAALDAAKAFGKKIASSFSSESSIEEAEKAGKALIKSGLLEGIKNNTPNTNSALGKTQAYTVAENAGIAAAKSMATKAVTDTAETAGKYVVQGFVNGITNNESLATDAGTALGKAALAAAKAALDENSPSKEMYKIGDYAGLGFVNALNDYADKAGKSGARMADSARMGLSRAISKVVDMVEGGIDAQPTIRPVLDLSSVESGTAAIGNMLSGRRTLSIDARMVRATAAAMSGYQNGGNSDVVSAIKGLRKDVSNMRGDTYTFGDFTYSGDSEVADAVQTLVRAIRVERRS